MRHNEIYIDELEKPRGVVKLVLKPHPEYVEVNGQLGYVDEETGETFYS